VPPLASFRTENHGTMFLLERA